MKVFESFNLCGYAITVLVFSSLALCESSSHTMPTSSTAGESSVLHDDSIQFDLVPDIVMDGSVVRVSYQCSRACEVGVEVVVYTQTKTGVAVFRRRWTNQRRLNVPRTHLVKLRFPPDMAYSEDLFMRHTLDVHNVMVRAWLDHLEQGKGDKDHGNRTSTYNGSLVRTFKVLQAVLPSQRPARPYPGCPSWMDDLRWQLTRDRIHQCPHESDTVDMLTFPMVSTGESFGVIRKIHPFINRDLERARALTVEQPRITVSIWIYLVQWCDRKLCGIIHHVDQNSKYDTPLIQLTNTGEIIIQVRLESGGDQAFRAHTALPLWTWIRLDCFIQGSKVTLQVKPEVTLGGMAEHTHIFDFQSGIHYNDTGGYFVIGGGRFMPGFHGYFGPIKYYRLGTEKVINSLSPAKTLEGLDNTHRECDEIREVTAAFLQAVTHNQEVFMTGLCHSHYISLWRRFGQNTCRQTWTWEAQKKHRALFTFLETQQEDFTPGTKNRRTLLHLGSRMFEHVVNRLSNRGSTQMDPTTTFSLIALLQTSSCYGYHHASLLLSTIHLAGLGGPVDQQQGHIYSLIGALGDNRLALMHLGYKHTQGIDGFPKDFDMAYSYYSNVGAQTSIDHGRVLENQQSITEHILISNEDRLNSLTHETGDAFQFIKLQADGGDVESQKLLAKLLFWGQNGVSKDVGTAVKWYAKSAMELEDPAAMYEYSILLFKGQGVKRNMTLGLQIMEKAAAMGSVQALNGLGWYYSTILKDYKTAYKYFEQAAHNGSHDGMFNLGVYHLNGKNPHNSENNETAAFHLFLNSSLYGHVDGAVEAAWYLSTGNLEGVSRDTERAVIMLKQICEQNGYLGYIVREALQAYLQGSRGEALVRYALAAETGLGVAQINVAYLCEVLKQSYDCQWRYYNHSTMNHAPHDSGLLKMGDYYYYSSSRLGAVDQAISLYSRAALAGSSQGIYKLVVLAQEGHDVPLIIRDRLNISVNDGLDIVVERLLQRCVELDKDEDLTPCTLALLRVQMGKAWRKITEDPIQLSLVYASVVTLIIALITVLIQSALECLQVDIPPRQRRHNNDRAVEDRTGTSPVNQAEVNGNGRQDQNDPIRREDRMPRTVRMAQDLWSILLRDGQRVQRTADLAVTVFGVCLCVLCTLILHHLL